MGEKGEGTGGEGGGKWGERGRELGMGYPLSTPSCSIPKTLLTEITCSTLRYM